MSKRAVSVCHTSLRPSTNWSVPHEWCGRCTRAFGTYTNTQPALVVIEYKVKETIKLSLHPQIHRHGSSSSSLDIALHVASCRKRGIYKPIEKSATSATVILIDIYVIACTIDLQIKSGFQNVIQTHPPPSSVFLHRPASNDHTQALTYINRETVPEHLGSGGNG